MLLVGALWAGLASAARADETRLIVNRKPDSVAIYLAMPAALLPEAYGGIPAQLRPGPDGLDLEPLRTGTVGVVDWMIDRSAARLGGSETRLEPLSAMVHPATLDLPFATPRDGSIATSVCTAPPSAPLGLDALTLYSGFFLYPVDGRQRLDLKLGELDPGSSITVSAFWDWSAISRDTIAVAPDGWVSLGAVSFLSTVPAPVRIGAGVAVLAALALVAGYLAVRVARKRPASDDAGRTVLP